MSLAFVFYSGCICIIINSLQFVTVARFCITVLIAVYYFLRVSVLFVVVIIFVNLNPSTFGIVEGISLCDLGYVVYVFG
jgi:hypothetical protein